jgi:hypothetical protein
MSIVAFGTDDLSFELNLIFVYSDRDVSRFIITGNPALRSRRWIETQRGHSLAFGHWIPFFVIVASERATMLHLSAALIFPIRLNH